MTLAAIAPTRLAEPHGLSLDELLASGGDDRLARDPTTGLNRYGCAPHPRADVLSFGSCTASSLTPGAYAAASRGRERLIVAAATQGTAAALRATCSQIETDILAAFGCADLADAILTASGTDAALTVTALLCAERPHVPMTSVLVSREETGSGVPLAVQGRHFANVTASGVPVRKGETVAGLPAAPSLCTIDVRDADGEPLAAADIALACDLAISDALPRGRVVLYAIDGSKTGLTAPDRVSLTRLAQRHGAKLDIVIDACQARIEPALIRAYLEQGFPVLVTGSKFFGAPGFCGAILFPRARLAGIAWPSGLADYTGRHGVGGSRHCPGLLLRWTAALHEMRRFAALPDGEANRRLESIGTVIRSALRTDERLRLVAAPRPDGPGWSSRRSVFTFTLRGACSLLDTATLRRLYLALQDDVSGWAVGCADPIVAATRCQIGQPVQLGRAIGGLRIAVSASDVVENADPSAAVSRVVRKLCGLLEG